MQILANILLEKRKKLALNIVLSEDHKSIGNEKWYIMNVLFFDKRISIILMNE